MCTRKSHQINKAALFVVFCYYRCEDPSLYSDPEDMMTVAHLYCVSLAFRLAIGGVSIAINSGLLCLGNHLS